MASLKLEGLRGAWRPSPLIAVSLVLPFALLLWLALRPSAWPIALAVFAANHVLLAICGLWPRSCYLGANVRRLPDAACARHEVAITFDDGPDPTVTPQVLACLDRFAAKATFFCPAIRAAAYPQLVREIQRRGHTVENHSWRHSVWFATYGWWRLRRELETSQRLLHVVSGRLPRFFRAPAGFRNPLLEPLLVRFGLRLVSWTRRGFDTACSDASRVLERLTRGLGAGDILLLHDGHSARTAAGIPVVLVVLPELLQRCVAAGLRPVALSEALREARG